jgi:HTH-type transcriptional regulator, sugar sensing transcriptional regulator
LQIIQATSVNDDIIKTFMEFGVSRSESRVFLALAQFGTITANEASKISGVSRPECYRVLVGLEKLGLVEKVLCNPTKYKALPMDDAFSLLIVRREKNNRALYKKTAHFNELFKAQKINSELAGGEDQFVAIPQGEALIIKLSKMVAEAQKNICVILPFNKLLSAFNEPFLVKALERGVVLKAITENPSGCRLPKFIINLQKKNNLEIKFIKLNKSLRYVIVDNKEVLITLSHDSGYLKSPSIWTNNDGFIELAQNYFNTAWEKN